MRRGLVSQAYLGSIEDYTDDLHDLLQEPAFMTGVRPDDQSFRIYITPTTSRLSNPAKAADAFIREVDDDWRDAKEDTCDSLTSIQNHSFYVVYVDTTTSERPRIAGLIMASELSQGSSSDTIDYFRKVNPDAEIPDDFQADSDTILWDIVSLMVIPEARDGVTSALLYHALFRRASETLQSVDAEHAGTERATDMRWIANLSEPQRRRLTGVFAVPFRLVQGVEPMFEAARVARRSTRYDFCSLYVSDIRPAGERRIEELRMSRKPSLAALVRIALTGQII